MTTRRKTQRPQPAARVLTVADLLAAKPRVEPVDLPALGGRVYVREWTAADADGFAADLMAMTEAKRKLAFRPEVLRRSVCDADGMLLFGPDDLDKLAALPASATKTLFEAADRINRVTGDAQDAAKGN